MQLKLLSPSDFLFQGGSGAVLELVELNGKAFISKTIIDSEEKASKLNLQYEWLSNRQSSSHIAAVANLSRKPGYCQYLLQFYRDYIPLNEYIAQSDSTTIADAFESILFYLDEKIHTSKTKVNSEEIFLSYLRTKLQDKVSLCARRSIVFNNFLQNKEIEINGKTYLNFYSCLETILKSQKIIKINSRFIQSNIHGDMTFENILINPETGHFVLIDPNVDNLVSGPLIDFSKLLQSGHSQYEALKRISIISTQNNAVCFELPSDEFDKEILFNCLRARLSEPDFLNLFLFEAIHYARMLPYKMEQTPHTFMIYYSQLIILLNDYLCFFTKRK